MAKGFKSSAAQTKSTRFWHPDLTHINVPPWRLDINAGRSYPQLSKGCEQCWIGRSDRAYRGGTAAYRIRHSNWLPSDRLELGRLDRRRARPDRDLCVLPRLRGVRHVHLSRQAAGLMETSFNRSRAVMP